MVEKNRKLQNQFDVDASSSLISDKNVFRGVSIFVDGFTVPSSQELRAYMLNYGGRYENYFSRRRVTHIICSNLPDSKIKNLRSFSRGLPIVKPNWIVDSVAANKLLNWVTYQLEQVACNQPRLSAFFSPKITPDSDDSLGDSSDQVKPESDNTSSVVPSIEDCNESSCRFSEHRMENSRESDMINGKRNVQFGKQSYTCENDFEVKLEGAPTSDAEDIVSTKYELTSSTHQSASVSSKRLPKSENMGSCQSHSTLGDPNFVENYLKSSRLHFIGTWRTRYHKRFPSSSKGSDQVNSNCCASDSSPKTPIIHIDMDRPLAVCHSDNPKGTAEISSANYPARDYGVRAGMFVRDAKARCPHLVILPYNFEAYEEVADQFYDILHKHCRKVQAVSCDEALLDVTYLEGVDTDMLASTVRQEIYEATGCTASAGIAGNMLMAHLATRAAKPDGQCNIPPEKVNEYLHELPIKILPGIGHVLEDKLKSKCFDMWTVAQNPKGFSSEGLWNKNWGDVVELSQETFYLTVNIIDRFLSVKTVPRRELQLVGISAMLIASKYEEIWPPQVDDFVCLCDNAYSNTQILVMEKMILGKLEWTLTVPTLNVFLVRFIKAAIPDEQMENMVYYLAELGMMHYGTLMYRPSMIAAAAVYAAKCTLNKSPAWCNTLKLHTGYSEDQLIECSKVLVKLHAKADKNKLKGVYNKYF